MKKQCKKAIDAIKGAYRFADEVYRHQATERLEWEARELENIFSLLTLGAFVGMQLRPCTFPLSCFPRWKRNSSS